MAETKKPAAKSAAVKTTTAKKTATKSAPKAEVKKEAKPEVKAEVKVEAPKAAPKKASKGAPKRSVTTRHDVYYLLNYYFANYDWPTSDSLDEITIYGVMLSLAIANPFCIFCLLVAALFTVTVAVAVLPL